MIVDIMLTQEENEIFVVLETKSELFVGDACCCAANKSILVFLQLGCNTAFLDCQLSEIQHLDSVIDFSYGQCFVMTKLKRCPGNLFAMSP